jgi:hypothetical protein
MRIFSVGRMLISSVLGFLLPLSYAVALSLFADYTGKPTPPSLVYPFGWPRPLWIFLLGRQPVEGDLIPGILFIALCNVVLYGTPSYIALTAFQALRHKPADPDLPPQLPFQV